jgi:hypothetical protein
VKALLLSLAIGGRCAKRWGKDIENVGQNIGNIGHFQAMSAWPSYEVRIGYHTLNTGHNLEKHLIQKDSLHLEQSVCPPLETCFVIGARWPGTSIRTR